MDLSVEASAAVLQQLRQFMADRRLQPGDRVPSIRDLSRRFGASVVDVRDALVQAEHDGLLEIRPRSGAFVRTALFEDGGAPLQHPSGVSSESLRATDARLASLHVVDGQQLHLCHAREILEVETSRKAAERCRPENLLPIRESLEAWLQAESDGNASDELDSDMMFHLGIARMAGNPVLTSILGHCLRQQHMLECGTAQTEEDRLKIRSIHIEIYEALRDRDPNRAAEAMRRHMQQLEHNISQLLFRQIRREPRHRAPRH